MRTAEREALLYRKVQSMLTQDKLALKQLDEAMDFAVRKGAKISTEMRALSLETTARIINGVALDPEHSATLESIVLGNGLRPAFDVEDDAFDPLPSVWDELNVAREALRPIIRSVGRLNVTGHPRVSYAGTAFVCGDDLMMTNRHVVEEFMQAAPGEFMLSYKPGMATSVDLKEEVGSAQASNIELTGRAMFSTELDVAVFEVKKLPAGVSPVLMTSAHPAELENRTAAVVGYPAFDASEQLMEQIAIFRGVFDKKRLQPGKLKGLTTVKSYGKIVSALAHDCSTLGGNSGATVVDVSSARVYGVHFSGTSGVANYAVPCWLLANDSALASVSARMSFA